MLWNYNNYTTFDELCSLAYKVELQKKAKLKREPPKPLTRGYPFDKGSYVPPPKSQNPPLGPSHHKPNDPKPPLTCMR